MGHRAARVVPTPMATVPPGLPRLDRRREVLARDGGACVWCSLPLSADDHRLSVDHVVPRIKGGPSWAENEVPACRRCNRTRGHIAPSLWLADCEGRGLRARRRVVERALLALRDAIAARGGQRKARPYLARELKRLGLE